VIGLRATGVSKAYGKIPILTNVDVELAAGDMAVLVGPNGVGKSTLLNCLAGAGRMDSGTVEVFGQVSDPTSPQHWVQVYGVLDDFCWLPGLSVLDHLMLLSPGGDVRVVEAALETFEISAVRNHKPVVLSSGQRQRVALATTWVRPWRVLLLDEPEAHLDVDGTDLLVRELRNLLAPERCILLSTHAPGLRDRLGCPEIRLASDLVRE
jgi:ABC-2 type transport system ATP-binding protein